MKKLLLDTIRIRGVRSANHSFESKAWLNHILLKLEKSLKIKAHSLRGFGWGEDEKGGLQLALAICSELYPPEVAKRVYPVFYQTFLAGIQEDGFDLTVDLRGFNRDVVDV
ncbi:MAG: hypothetical protein MUC59_07260 [Saprospiraceae bacterium]|jgi:hypothetical protein|nr:hypothetical protein [Saprospiraceae bacterium]